MILLAAIPGFPGNQTSLNPAGPAAAHIEHTFALIFWITERFTFSLLTALTTSSGEDDTHSTLRRRPSQRRSKVIASQPVPLPVRWGLR